MLLPCNFFGPVSDNQNYNFAQLFKGLKGVISLNIYSSYLHKYFTAQNVFVDIKNIKE